MVEQLCQGREARPQWMLLVAREVLYPWVCCASVRWEVRLGSGWVCLFSSNDTWLLSTIVKCVGKEMCISAPAMLVIIMSIMSVLSASNLSHCHIPGKAAASPSSFWVPRRSLSADVVSRRSLPAGVISRPCSLSVFHFRLLPKVGRTLTSARPQSPRSLAADPLGSVVSNSLLSLDAIPDTDTMACWHEAIHEQSNHWLSLDHRI